MIRNGSFVYVKDGKMADEVKDVTKEKLGKSKKTIEDKIIEFNENDKASCLHFVSTQV